MDSFYKNLSIMGGFLLLYITGAENIRLIDCSVSPRRNYAVVRDGAMTHCARRMPDM